MQRHVLSHLKGAVRPAVVLQQEKAAGAAVLVLNEWQQVLLDYAHILELIEAAVHAHEGRPPPR